MENRPVISLTSRSPAPGSDLEVYERYLKWQNEVYYPMVMKVQEPTGLDSYQIIGEHPEYPPSTSILHCKNLKELGTYAVSLEGTAIVQEYKSWTDRGIIELVWSGAYALIKSFRVKTSPAASEDTRIQNAPVLHLEAYRLSQEEQGKYVKWFNDYGYRIFLPLFMKLPGFAGYDWYEFTGFRRYQGRELENPKYLSIIYFENYDDYIGYARSPELAGFQKVMRNVFPLGLNFKWYVQYHLVKSWRK